MLDNTLLLLLILIAVGGGELLLYAIAGMIGAVIVGPLIGLLGLLAIGLLMAIVQSSAFTVIEYCLGLPLAFFGWYGIVASFYYGFREGKWPR